ncbi:hypothetical protein ALC57_18402 [Trachymyrmex cornetzi]|uniref:Uncharacterized protein n=1 Tax=Trachymyrmex cornetzi TaxID=471704 RepID=A0A151IRZ2_9HYME|nr:hypothetical protein ALC57_18402 [Trachymyrmex cornetzi]
MEGRLDFISQVYGQWRTPERRTSYRSGIWVSVFRVKEMNLYNSGVDQVQFLVNARVRGPF